MSESRKTQSYLNHLVLFIILYIFFPKNGRNSDPYKVYKLLKPTIDHSISNCDVLINQLRPLEPPKNRMPMKG